MTIYVDSAIWRSARRPGTRFCHVASDSSIDELHAFAARAGLPERAFHRDHYDVPAHARPHVVAAGATPVDTKTLVRRLRAAGLRRR